MKARRSIDESSATGFASLLAVILWLLLGLARAELTYRVDIGTIGARRVPLRLLRADTR